VGEERRHWLFGDLALWTEWLRQDDVLLAGAMRALATNPAQQEISHELLEAIFRPPELARLQTALRGSPAALLHWWRDALAPEFRNRVQFPVDIATMRGPKSLERKPQVVVGTIHSVKGGQADVVYLFPDLSSAAADQYGRPGETRDAVIRTFYVGATRAREVLYVCSAEGSAAVQI